MAAPEKEELMSDVEMFASLFRGRVDAYGTGAGPVERKPLTIEEYANHLAGAGEGIGVFPMLDTNEVYFCAIDLDEPDFDLARTMQKLIPGTSWIERSRSGNAHVWVFFEDSCPAWAARTILMGATEAVGRPEVEIFPKQDKLRKGGSKPSVGNYINLPYHGRERPILVDDGTEFEVELFIDGAIAERQDPEAWVRRARRLGGKPPEERATTSDWGTSPMLHMCAEKIIAERQENPIREGNRHIVLFNIAKQCLNYEGFSEDEAKHWVEDVNRCSERPLPQFEIDRLFDNAVEGRFTSTGCDDPVMQPYTHPDCPIAHGG